MNGNPTAKNTYLARLNKVQDYVKEHLDTDLSLDTLASIGCFSKFYFHRIFSAMTGESVNAFVNRCRLELAAFKLLNNRSQSITNIALSCGFSSSAVFTRSFKAYYHCSPTAWRTEQNRKICKADLSTAAYTAPRSTLLTRRMEMSSQSTYRVDVKTLAAMPIAYVRHRGAYHANDKVLFQGMFKHLLDWALPRGLFTPPETKAFTVFSSGHPDITTPDHLCVDVGISVTPQVTAQGEIGVRKLPAGTYAVITLNEANIAECEQAWDFLFKEWLPESGYEPGDGAYFIQHLNDPEQHPKKLHDVAMHLPVRPLNRAT